jgi:hypothetical protein
MVQLADAAIYCFLLPCFSPGNRRDALWHLYFELQGDLDPKRKEVCILQGMGILSFQPNWMLMFIIVAPGKLL